MPLHRLPTSAFCLLMLSAVALAAAAAQLDADVATLKNGGIASDGPALLEFFRQRTLSSDDQTQIADAVRRLGNNEFAARQKASQELIARGRVAIPFLRLALTSADLEVARRAERCLREIESSPATSQTLAAARLLAARQPAGAVEVVLKFLPFADDEIVEDELMVTLAAVGLRDGKAEPLVMEALRDKVPLRRSAAALVVARSTRPEQRAAVRPLLTDGEARVRMRAAHGLLMSKEKDAIPTLIALLADGPVSIAWQAEELLCRLAADQAPPVSIGGGVEAERRKCRDAWSAWWRERGTQLDLAGLDVEQRTLGLTLIVAFDGYGHQGKVWETRGDGKPRWEIASVQGPIDAQVLPGNRVLIAEHNARKVSERDLQGKVLWEFAIPNSQYPVACQRLPGGSTFIATYNQVFEVSADNKLLYSYPCKQGIIYSAQKQRNGHIVYVTSNGTLVELDESGKEVRSLRIGAIGGWVTVEALPGGRFLVPQSSTGKVVELDGEGKVALSYNVANANSVSKLANGNLLVCRHNDRTVAEIDRTGKVIWEQRLEGRPFWARRR